MTNLIKKKKLYFKYFTLSLLADGLMLSKALNKPFLYITKFADEVDGILLLQHSLCPF